MLASSFQTVSEILLAGDKEKLDKNLKARWIEIRH